ncbi:TorF family putative porin [Massilia solisilvae]
MKMKQAVTAALALAACNWIVPMAQAQEQPAAEHQVSYNAAVVSDYRYRGISQSRLDPALQGGADYTHTPTGLYAGTWLSTIHWTGDLGGSGSVEWDLYGGKRGELGGGVSYDVGGLYYFYPNNGLHPNANTFELYGQLGYGPGYLKYSRSLTNLFGTADSKQSGYWDLGANIDTGWQAVTLQLHVGRQQVHNNDALSYTDYKVGLARDFGWATVGLAWVKTNTSAYVAPDGRSLGRSGVVASLTKTF